MELILAWVGGIAVGLVALWLLALLFGAAVLWLFWGD